MRNFFPSGSSQECISRNRLIGRGRHGIMVMVMLAVRAATLVQGQQRKDRSEGQ